MSEPHRSSFLDHLARKRDLCWQFTVRTIEMQHKGSYLGVVWSVLNPLLMFGLYVVVFGFIFNGRLRPGSHDTPVDYALGLFLGLLLFNVLSEILGIGPTLIVSNPNLVKKVVFPLEILPIAQIGASWFHLLISLVLLIIGIVALHRDLTLVGLLWLPVLLLPHALLSLGLCWFLAAFGVFFRDVNQVVPFLSQIVFWSSAIAYSPAIIPPSLWSIMRWNPLLQTVELARQALLWHEPVSLARLGYIYAAGAVTFLFGGWFFRRTRSAFADVI